MDETEKKFIQIIKEQNWLMDALRDVMNLGLPDCYIAGGAIRNTIWNYFHGCPTDSNQNDVDVAYFDFFDKEGEKEKRYEKILKDKSPNLKWEVINQVRMHLFKYEGITRPRMMSSYDSIAYWSETSNCVGVRLNKDKGFTICAPHGLEDLMNLIVRPVPEPYQNLALYKKRIKNKKWKKIWPKLEIINA